MGATCSINAAKRLLTMAEVDNVKAVLTMHPGLCGWIGPPPGMWFESDLKAVTERFPTMYTTARNDAAFLPSPYGSEREQSCYEGGVNGTSIFVDYAEAACNEDDARKPFPDGGH